MSLFSIADGLAPDIVHFTNFIKENITTSSQRKNFTMGEFISLLVKYFFQPKIVDINNDGFSKIDLADSQTCNLSTNFDIFTYDLFDNWYSGATKPTYGLKPGGITGLGMVNNDSSDSLKIGLRTVKQNFNYEINNLAFGYADLNKFFTKGYTTGILDTLFTTFLGNSYQPAGIGAAVGIKLSFSIFGKTFNFTVPIDFSSTHEAEFSKFISNNLKLNSSVSVGTKFTMDNSNDNTFKVYVSNDGNSWVYLKDKGVIDFGTFATYLANNNVIDYRFVMSGFSSSSTFTTVHGKNVTLKLNNNNFQFTI